MYLLARDPRRAPQMLEANHPEGGINQSKTWDIYGNEKRRDFYFIVGGIRWRKQKRHTQSGNIQMSEVGEKIHIDSGRDFGCTTKLICVARGRRHWGTKIKISPDGH